MSRLPTREEILAFIRDSDEKIGKREIARAFKIKGAERVQLKELLSTMQSEGLIDGSRKAGVKPHGHLPAVAMIEITALRDDGYLIARPLRAGTLDEGVPDITILVPPQRKMRSGRTQSLELGVGNHALARLSPTHGHQYQARIIKKISSQTEAKIIGRVHIGQNGPHLISANKRDRSDYRLLGPEAELVHDTLVIAQKILGKRRDFPAAEWLETIGPAGHPHAFSLIAIAEQDLPFDFPAAVIEEAENGPRPESIERQDLRELPFITIDPADARDHDDAICATSTENGFTLWVAIADVAAFVRPGTLLDREARKRGNSVYMPDRVIPMLPEQLSADACSLKAQSDRPALVAKIMITTNGEIGDYTFLRATIRISAGYSYEEAQREFDGFDLSEPYTADYDLKNLWACYRTMAEARDRRGPLDLNRPEQRVVLDAQGNISDIITPPRLEAHRLIEEMMVSANVCAAKILSKKNMPQLFRVHDGPQRERLRNFAEFVKPFGVSLDLGQTILPRLFNHALSHNDDPFARDMISEAVLRTQAQAVYATDNIGHFGLNLSHYAHFTSPIRRYSDLLTHRALIASLGLGPDGLSDWDREHLDETAAHISLTERKAMLAERTARERYLSAFMSDRIGEHFDATVSGLSRAGMFVRLIETGAEGLIPISKLGTEYFTLDEDGFTLRGASGLCFRIGSVVEVQLRETLPLKGGIVFSLIAGGERLGGHTRNGRRSGKGPRSGKNQSTKAHKEIGKGPSKKLSKGPNKGPSKGPKPGSQPRDAQKGRKK